MNQDHHPDTAAKDDPPPSLPWRAMPLVLAVGALVLLSVWAFVQTRSYENSQMQAQFRALSESRAVAVQRGIDSCVGLLDSIDGLYKATDVVNREMFAVFVRGALTGFSAVQALVFTPRVEGQERQAFEQAVRAEGFPNFTITERTPDGKMIPDASRSQYFPVYLVEPFQNNLTAFGFDFSSNPTRLQALGQAADSASPVATGRLTLVTETGGQYGFIIFRPIYKKNAPTATREERQENLAGFAVGVFRAGTLMESALGNIAPAGIDMWLVDLDAPADENLLNFHAARLGGQVAGSPAYPDNGLLATIPLDIPGRKWVLRFAATPAFLAGYPVWRPWLVLGCGLLMALLLGLYMRKALKHYCLVETHAKERADTALVLQEKIDQLKLAQTQTQENAEKLQVILTGMRAGIFTIDAQDQIILDLNPMAEELFGISRPDWLGRNFHDLVGENTCHVYPISVPDASASPSLVEVECLVDSRQGRTIPMRRLTLSSSSQERAVIFEVFFDISEKKALERQLTLSQKLESIGQLAAGIAHEINTPIQYVSSNLDFVRGAMDRLLAALSKCRVALGRQPSQEAAQEAKQAMEDTEMDFLLAEIPKALKDSFEGTQRVASIVLSIKKFAHPGDDEKKAVDINAAIENTVQVARNEWKYVAEVVLNLDPELPQVPCVPGELNQVILNILVNAAQAIGQAVGTSGGKGRITISTRQKDGFAEIVVADTGSGIPESVRSRVYDPFFTTKGVGQGTGQGLAIVFSVIKKHGGSVNFTSQENKGTTFVVRLPLNEQPA